MYRNTPVPVLVLNEGQATFAQTCVHPLAGSQDSTPLKPTLQAQLGTPENVDEVAFPGHGAREQVPCHICFAKFHVRLPKYPLLHPHVGPPAAFSGQGATTHVEAHDVESFTHVTFPANPESQEHAGKDPARLFAGHATAAHEPVLAVTRFTTVV